MQGVQPAAKAIPKVREQARRAASRSETASCLCKVLDFQQTDQVQAENYLTMPPTIRIHGYLERLTHSRP